MSDTKPLADLLRERQEARETTGVAREALRRAEDAANDALRCAQLDVAEQTATAVHAVHEADRSLSASIEADIRTSLALQVALAEHVLRLEAAVLALADSQGTGPGERISAILEGRTE